MSWMLWMLCTRREYRSVWLIIPTMIFSQHFTAWLLQHQQMWKTPEEIDQPLGLTRAGSSSPDIFSWLRPWPRPCSTFQEDCRGRDCKYQSGDYWDSSTPSDVLVPSSSQRSTRNTKYQLWSIILWHYHGRTRLSPLTICRLLQNDSGDW